jgi:hypothetical protein
MPKIFVKKEDLIFMGVYPFLHFGNLGVVVGVYIGIYNVDVERS